MADSDTHTARKPDAVLYHTSLKQGRSSVDRARHIQMLVGPILGGTKVTQLGARYGGRVHSSEVGDGWYLATLDPDDSLLFPTTHDYARQPRYRWEDQPDGTRHGWLLSPREIEEQALAETSAETQRRIVELEAWEKHKAENQAKLARWRELASISPETRTPAQEEELKQLYVELFSDYDDEF